MTFKFLYPSRFEPPPGALSAEAGAPSMASWSPQVHGQEAAIRRQPSLVQFGSFGVVLFAASAAVVTVTTTSTQVLAGPARLSTEAMVGVEPPPGATTTPPSETVTLDKWFQPTSQPVFEIPPKPVEDIFWHEPIPQESIGVGPADKLEWFPPTQQPLFDVQPLLVEDIWWHEPLPQESIGVGEADKVEWFPPIERPPSGVEPLVEVGEFRFNPLPIPPPGPAPDFSWFVPTQQPLNPEPLPAAVGLSVQNVYPISSVPSSLAPLERRQTVTVRKVIVVEEAGARIDIQAWVVEGSDDVYFVPGAAGIYIERQGASPIEEEEEEEPDTPPK